MLLKDAHATLADTPLSFYVQIFQYLLQKKNGILITTMLEYRSMTLMGASINSESQFFHFADSTQNNAESLSTDPMLRLFCRGSC